MNRPAEAEANKLETSKSSPLCSVQAFKATRTALARKQIDGGPSQNTLRKDGGMRAFGAFVLSLGSQRPHQSNNVTIPRSILSLSKNGGNARAYPTAEQVCVWHLAHQLTSAHQSNESGLSGSPAARRVDAIFVSSKQASDEQG